MTFTPADSVLLSYNVCIIIIVTICYMDFFKHFFVADLFRVGLYCILHVGKATFESILLYELFFSVSGSCIRLFISWGFSYRICAKCLDSGGRMVQTIGNTQCTYIIDKIYSHVSHNTRTVLLWKIV